MTKRNDDMIKKFTAYAAAFAVITGVFTGCKVKDETDTQENSSAVTTAVQSTLQPDPLDPKKTTSAVTTVTSSVTTAAETAPNETQPDPMINNAFSIDESGAVVMEIPVEEQNDDILIAAAQKLYNSACETQWKFLYEPPYDLDYTETVENEFGWEFYRIKTGGIKTFADVENDYHRVFSDRYPNTLSETYREENGSVYAFTGGRGSDLYYSDSMITAIESRKADEIFFTVESLYSGSDFGDEEYTKTDTFSAVIVGDVWYVGVFELPF